MLRMDNLRSSGLLLGFSKLLAELEVLARVPRRVRHLGVRDRAKVVIECLRSVEGRKCAPERHGLRRLGFLPRVHAALASSREWRWYSSTSTAEIENSVPRVLSSTSRARSAGMPFLSHNRIASVETLNSAAAADLPPIPLTNLFAGFSMSADDSKYFLLSQVSLAKDARSKQGL